MKAFLLPNLVSVQVTVGNPIETVSQVPQFSKKEDFRTWCAAPSTRHAFYSLNEGVNPNLRISEQNSPYRAHGWVADFDGTVNPEAFTRAFEKFLPPELRPYAMSSTFSGGARAVWLFEQAQFLDEEDVAAQFMHLLAKRLKVTKLAPGYDEASQKPSEFWELGHDWKVLSENRIPAFLLAALQVEALKKSRRAVTKKTAIGLETARDYMLQAYPQLANVVWEEGTRVPLFWLNDGNSDLSAVLMDWGIYSFSTRAERSALPWQFFLGEEVCQQYTERQTADVANRYWFDGTKYWGFNCVRWVPWTKEDVKDNLFSEGYGKKQIDGEPSEIDQIMYHIRNKRRVVAACTFPHTREEIFEYRSRKFLNAEPSLFMRPAPVLDNSKWPWLLDYFDHFLSDQQDPILKIPAKFSFLAELQRAYLKMLEGKGSSGHVLVFAGAPDRGKSFLACKLLPFIFGSGADAGRFLMKETHFNKAVGESYIWYVDDNESAGSTYGHMTFSERLKKYAATPEISFERKYGDETMLPWYGRIVITCNDDPHSLSILPNLEMSIREKLCLYRMHSSWQATFKENDAQEAMVRDELPYFLKWLVESFKPPQALVENARARYGLNPFHDPSLVESATNNNPSLQIRDTIDIWRCKVAPQDKSYTWAGSTSELLSEMHQDMGLAQLLRSVDVVRFGRMLSQCYAADSLEGCLGKQKTRGREVWRFTVPSRAEVAGRFGELPGPMELSLDVV